MIASEYFQKKKKDLLRERSEHVVAIEDIDRRIKDIEEMEAEVGIDGVPDTTEHSPPRNDVRRSKKMFDRADRRYALLRFMQMENVGYSNRSLTEDMVERFRSVFPSETEGYHDWQVHRVISSGLRDLYVDRPGNRLIVDKEHVGRKIKYWIDVPQSGGGDPGEGVAERDENGYVNPDAALSDDEDASDE